MISHSVHVSFQIGLERCVTLGRFQILPQMDIISFVQRAEPAGMRAQWRMRDNVNVNSREKSVVSYVSAGQFFFADFFSSNNGMPRRPRQHQVVSMTGRNGIAPAVRFEGVKHGDIRTDSLRHDNLLTRVKWILSN
jgi:hypothetical protein